MVDRVFNAVAIRKNIFVDPGPVLQHSITNVGSTVVTLAIIIFTLSLVVNFVNDEADIPIANLPDVEGYITNVFNQMGSVLGIGYNIVKDPFKGNQDLLIGGQAAFVCPIKDKGLHTITSCFFHFMDVSIYNALDTIPGAIYNAWSRTIVAIDTTIQKLFPQHLVIHDVINSIRLFIQRFIPLDNPATEKPIFISGGSANTSTTNTKASFYFEPFSDNVIQVKETCVAQCGLYATSTRAFIFETVAQQSTTVTTKMTVRDYLFNEFGSTTIYICQYEQSSNFGGTWLLFDDSCICGSSCSSANYFDFSGCADLLDRIGITCSSTTPCTVDRLCPYPETKLAITSTDGSDVLYDHIDNVCLDICAELAGFGDFATLVAAAATAGILPVTNIFGLFSSSSFGGPAGVPAALLPGNFDFVRTFKNHLLVSCSKVS